MGVLWLRSLDEVLDAALTSGWTPSHTDLTVTMMLGGIYGDVRAAVKWLASPAMQGCAQPEVALHRALLRLATSHRSTSLTLPCTTASYPSPPCSTTIVPCRLYFVQTAVVVCESLLNTWCWWLCRCGLWRLLFDTCCPRPTPSKSPPQTWVR